MSHRDAAARFTMAPGIALGGALFAAATAASAGGLLLYEVGSADVGLASAGYTARAQDASTVLTNPAGMTRLAGRQLTLGAQALYGDVGFSIAPGTSPALGQGDGGNPIGWFPGGGLFYSQQVSPDIALGFAATGNFGLAEKFDDGWVGRYYVQESTLLGVSLLPSLAWRVNPQLSLGASLNATYGILENKVAVNNPASPLDGALELQDEDWGFGVNLGLLYEISPSTRLGLTYTSEVELDFDTRAEFSGLAPGLNAILGARGLLNAPLSLGITIPQAIHASFFHQVNDRWAVLGSLGWQEWSKFGRVDLGIDSNDPQSLTTSLDFKDTWHAALGVQVQVAAPWSLNLGVAYDSEFQDNDDISPALPANAAWRFGVGLQNQVSPDFEWGLAVTYVYGGEIDVNRTGDPPAVGGRGDLVGSYDVDMLFLSANFNWKLR